MSARTLLAAFCACLLLGACASAPPPPSPRTLKIAVSASWVVNPDESGRASPIVLRLYQLKSDDVFASADFYALYDGDTKVLGAAMLGREELHLVPGQHIELERPVAPGATRFAVLAGFRDVDRARWRAVADVTPASVAHADVSVDGTTVGVAVR